MEVNIDVQLKGIEVLHCQDVGEGVFTAARRAHKGFVREVWRHGRLFENNREGLIGLLIVLLSTFSLCTYFDLEISHNKN